MADKTILDFPELFDNLDDDPMYLLRGTGTARDRHQTRLNFLQDILQIGIVEYTITRSYLADISFVNLSGSIYQAIKGNQISGDPLENKNKSPDTNPLWWRLVWEKPIVSAYDDTEAVAYEVVGVLVEQYGDHYTSTGKAGNLGKDPVDPVNIAYWFPSDGAKLLEKIAKKGRSERGDMHPINDRAGTEYAQNILIDKIKKGSITYNEFMVKLDGTVVTGNTTLEDIFDIGGANEYPYIDIYAPEELGTRTLIDMGGRVTEDMTSGGVVDVMGFVHDDYMQRITGSADTTGSGNSTGATADSGALKHSLSGVKSGAALAANNKILEFDSTNSISPNPAKTNDDRTAHAALVTGISYIVVMVAV